MRIPTDDFEQSHSSRRERRQRTAPYPIRADQHHDNAHRHATAWADPFPSNMPRGRRSGYSTRNDPNTLDATNTMPAASSSRHHLSRRASPGTRAYSYEHAGPETNPKRDDPKKDDKGPILFYNRDQPYFEFTNFSHHPVEYDGLIYPTCEHLFQAHKFLSNHPDLAERIRTLPSAREALREATRLKRLQRPDWFDVNVKVMENILYEKFTQHPDLRQLLKGTGDRELIEDSPVDAFWGVGPDGQGRNELGKALMKVRAKL